MDAVLIQRPFFRVQLDTRTQPSNGSTSLRQKISNVAHKALDVLKLLLVSLKNASCYVLMYALLATRIALVYVATPQLAAITWIACMTISWGGVGLIFFFKSLINNGISSFGGFPPSAPLAKIQHYLKQAPRLAPQHLQGVDFEVDMSKIPKSFTLQSLMPVLDEVTVYNQRSKDFCKNQPGALQEPVDRDPSGSPIILTKNDLKKHLKTLVNNIQTKASWLGAPPSTHIQAVNQFYQKLNNFVLFSAYTTIDAYNTFVNKNGIPVQPTKDSSVEGKELYNQYCNVLEDRNRTIVDLAVSGSRCAGRAMGDSLDMYCRIAGKTQGDSGALKDRVVHALAQLRERIMREDVTAYVNDRLHPQRLAHNTHYFSAYIAQLGTILGIPGSNGVTEHLVKINESEMLRSFFSKYTTEVIINEFRDKYDGKGWYGDKERQKGSTDFRELFQDWLQQQAGDWNQEKYNQIQSQMTLPINAIRNDPLIKQEAQNKLQQFAALINYLKTDEDAQISLKEIIGEKQGNYFFKKYDEEKGDIEIPLENAPCNEIVDALKRMPEVSSWILENTASQETKENIDDTQNRINMLSQFLTNMHEKGVVQKMTQSPVKDLERLIGSLKDQSALERVIEPAEYLPYRWLGIENANETFRKPNSGEKIDLATVGWNELFQALTALPQAKTWIERHMQGFSNPTQKWQTQFNLEDNSDQAKALKEIVIALMRGDADRLNKAKSSLSLSPVFADSKQDIYEPLKSIELKNLLTLLANTDEGKEWFHEYIRSNKIILEGVNLLERIASKAKWVENWIGKFSKDSLVGQHEQNYALFKLEGKADNGRCSARSTSITIRMIQKQRIINQLIDPLNGSEFVAFLNASLKEAGIDQAQGKLQSHVAANLQAKRINSILQAANLPPLGEDERLGFVTSIQKTDLNAVHTTMKEHLQRMREKEFLMELLGPTQNNQIQPLRKELIEWFLISHGILQY